MTLVYQIWRKADKQALEPGDVFIANRLSRTVAEKWIETQKNQRYNHTWYYIKEVNMGAGGDYVK